MKLEADKIVQNILHSVCVICSLHHVILYVGTIIFEELLRAYSGYIYQHTYADLHM
jgi:hypothetical protein